MDTLHSACWALGLLTLLRFLYSLCKLVFIHCFPRPFTLAQRYGRSTWAVVTGASFGIGSSFARSLAAEGFNLVLIARSEDRLHALASSLRLEFGTTVETIVVDLSSPSAYSQVSQAMAGKKWSILVNNAGALHFTSFAHLSREDVESLIDLNVKAVACLSHLFAHTGEPRKALINLSSMSGVLPLPLMAVYSGTKAFTKAFSEALSGECQFDVLCLSPVCVSSNMTFNLSSCVFEASDSYAASSLRTLSYTPWSAGSLHQAILHSVITSLPHRAVQHCFQSLLRVLHLFTLEPQHTHP